MKDGMRTKMKNEDMMMMDGSMWMMKTKMKNEDMMMMDGSMWMMKDGMMVKTKGMK